MISGFVLSIFTSWTTQQDAFWLIVERKGCYAINERLEKCLEKRLKKRLE